MWLRQGRVIRAQIDGRNERIGKAAAFHMLGWDKGRFELTRDEIEGHDEIRTPTTHLLMEAARQQDEAEAEATGEVGLGGRATADAF